VVYPFLTRSGFFAALNLDNLIADFKKLPLGKPRDDMSGPRRFEISRKTKQ
jgi:hypothetical protein